MVNDHRLTDALQQLDDLLSAFSLLYRRSRRPKRELRQALRHAAAGIVDAYLMTLRLDPSSTAGTDRDGRGK